MSAGERLVSVGRVGRPHGRDGAFHVEGAEQALDAGTAVTVGGRRTRVERRAGTAQRPILRLSGVAERPAAAALRGEALLVPEFEAPLEEGEWLVEDLIGCEVEGIGSVRRVLAGSSCDLLEVGEEATLVPLVRDAVREVDLERRVIEVDRGFLALGEERPAGVEDPAAADSGAREVPR